MNLLMKDDWARDFVGGVDVDEQSARVHFRFGFQGWVMRVMQGEREMKWERKGRMKMKWNDDAPLRF